jgi:phosphatidylserine decarboxylase
VLAVALIAIASQFGPVIAYPLIAVGVLAVAFTVYFFRDPSRQPPAKASGMLLAPADGKIVEIVEEHEPLYLKGPARRISIFLSPLNVHVNRAPADGVIEFDQYVAGEYLVAWHPKASEKNERSQLGVRHTTGVPILFKQIAGAVARRIVYHITVGDTVRAGERFGIVKFGSRMDVIIPPHIPVFAQIGDRVVAGETILGHLIPEAGETN